MLLSGLRKLLPRLTYDDIIAFMIWNNGEKHECVALLRLDTLSARAARRAGVHGRQHNAEDY